MNTTNNTTTTTTTTTVTNLAELTRKNCAFAGCELIKPESKRHPGKGDVKGREFILVPFMKFNGETFAQFTNLDAVTLPKLGGFAITLKGTGGKTAGDPVERLTEGIALLMTTETRVNALRAKLGGIDYAKFAELLNRFNGSDAQLILAILNRADAMTREGKPVTFETLRPAPKSK